MNVIERIEKGEINIRLITDFARYGGIIDDESKAELLRLAKLGQQMQWVSVYKRFPEVNQDVLIAKGKSVDSGWLNLHGNFIGLGGIQPTHWMPLPPAPKGEE